MQTLVIYQGSLDGVGHYELYGGEAGEEQAGEVQFPTAKECAHRWSWQSK